MTKLGIGLKMATLTLATALTTTLAPAGAQAHGGGHDGHGNSGKNFPAVVQLPNGFRPEGIAIRGKTAYFGSLADGDIHAVNLRTGKGAVVSQGPGTPSVGLKIDKRDRLFVAGGPAGNARVVDVRTGAILKTYQFTTGASFINDVAFVGRTAWFTDSSNPVLYGVPLGRHGTLPDASAVITLPLTGDYVHQAGFNLNGITPTPDGRAILAVQTSTGLLFRIDPKTGIAKTVDLGGYALTNGDGLLTLDRTLYVVQNQSNLVAVFRLNHRGTSGVLEKTLTNPDFDVPTTIAKFGRWLYLPNARFSTTPTPDTTYTAVRVRR
ncbi:MAG TPA: superoxide dismutase [Propionicimonas sp.]|jgi:sugar lactone lactonase YvrE|uniref:superoxide dismutase n=1 Tax=Propionicimonas sp. TaxID=1955623 RepID=UPI002F412266